MYAKIKYDLSYLVNSTVEDKLAFINELQASSKDVCETDNTDVPNSFFIKDVKYKTVELTKSQIPTFSFDLFEELGGSADNFVGLFVYCFVENSNQIIQNIRFGVKFTYSGEIEFPSESGNMEQFDIETDIGRMYHFSMMNVDGLGDKNIIIDRLEDIDETKKANFIVFSLFK